MIGNERINLQVANMFLQIFLLKYPVEEWCYTYRPANIELPAWQNSKRIVCINLPKDQLLFMQSFFFTKPEGKLHELKTCIPQTCWIFVVVNNLCSTTVCSNKAFVIQNVFGKARGTSRHDRSYMYIPVFFLVLKSYCQQASSKR